MVLAVHSLFFKALRLDVSTKRDERRIECVQMKFSGVKTCII